MYKLTESIDEVDRITLKVTYRMTLRDMANLIVCDWGFNREEYNSSVKIMMRLPNRLEVIKSVKRGLIWDSLEAAPIRVGDQNFEYAADMVEYRLKQLWGVS